MPSPVLIPADGVPLLAVGTTTNVQSRKTAEGELARLNADLELRVARRTAELEDVNSELNSFSYTIAHDMRAPVRAINGFSEIVLKNNEGKLDAASVGHLKRVVAGSRHMGALIDDLSTFGRTSLGLGLNLDCAETDFATRALDEVEQLRGAHPDRQIELTVDGKTVHQVGIPLHWGFSGVARNGYLTNTLTPFVGDANTLRS